MMNINQCQVSRSGKIVGVYDFSEIPNLISLGIVLPTDYYWMPGMDNWSTVDSNRQWENLLAPAPPSGSFIAPPVVKPKDKIYPVDMLVCTRCGSTVNEKFTKGSIVIEILLWALFCIPGLIYSIWRLATRCRVCSTCKSDQLIPANSPSGKKILSKS